MTRSNSPIDAWLWHFEVKLGSNAPLVYNNGRQQVQVDIDIQAADDESVTQAQLDSLTLVVRQRNGQYAPLSMNPDDAWYYAAEHDPRFDYYPSLSARYLPPSQDESEHTLRTKSLYVSSNANAGSILEVRARISRSPGEYYYTDSVPFDSSLQLTCVAAPTLHFPQDYNFERVREEGSVDSGTFIHEWALTPRDIGFAYAEFLPGHKRGTLRWQERAIGETYATHVGLALPGSNLVHYDDSLPTGRDFQRNRQVRHAQQGSSDQLVVLVQGDHHIPYVPGNRRREDPINVHAVDRYGTSHHLNIGFDGQQRVDLRVTARQDQLRFAQAPGTLDFFQVRGLNRDGNDTTCVVYANGHQQTEVAVLVRARNADGEIIDVPDTELANIEFIDYNTGVLLPRGDFTISSTKNDAFDYHPDNHQLRVLPAPGQGSVKSFYISTRRTGNTKIAARLAYRGRTYRTNDRSLPAGGEVSSGRANSSATVQGRPQNYKFNAEHFNIKREDYLNHSRSHTEVDVDRYAITFKDINYQIRASIHERDLENAYHYTRIKWTHSGRVKYGSSYRHYAFTVGKFTHYNFFHKSYPNGKFTVFIDSPRGTAYAMRVRAPIVPKATRSARTKVVYLDQNGNSHPVWFGHSDGGNVVTLN